MKKLLIAGTISLLLGLATPSLAAVLFPTQGGTGTGVKPTSGQILVGNSSGLYSPTTTISGGLNILGSVGIGTTTPITRLQIGTSTTAVTTLIGGSSGDGGMYISYKNSGFTGGFVLESTSNSASNQGAGYVMLSNDGAAMASGDRLGFNVFGGSVSSTSTSNGAGLVAYADGDWTTTSTPSRFAFELAPSGSVTRAEVMTIKSTGNVGIGTTTPVASLDVVGSTLPLRVFGTGITGTGNLFRVQNGFASTTFVALGNGNVGVGIDTPVSPFHIQSATLPQLMVNNTDINSQIQIAATRMLVGYNTSQNDGYVGGGTSKGLRIFANNASSTPNIYVTSTFVGISTTTPSYTFDVDSSNSSVARFGRSGTGAIATVEIGTTGAGAINNGGGIHFTSFNASSSLKTNAYIRGINTSSTVAGFSGDLVIGTTLNGTLSEKMRILSSGNVGIGTTTPSNKLDIDGTVGNNLGIRQGSTNSLAQLLFYENHSTNTGYITSRGSTAATPNLFQVGGAAGHSLALHANATEYLRITSTGLIGIGTTTPTSTLDVVGYANYNQVYASMAEVTNGTSTGSTIKATTTGAFYGWTGASSTISASTGITYASTSIVSGATSTITMGSSSAGIYQVGFSAALTNGINDTVHCAVFKNGVKTAVAGEARVGTNGDTINLSGGPLYLSLAAADVLDLRCTDETAAGTTITFLHVNFGIHRISR